MQRQTAEISLGELRVFIDRSNNLLMTGFLLSIDTNPFSTDGEDPQEKFVPTLNKWEEKVVADTIPPSVATQLIDVLSHLKLNEETLESGLEVIAQALLIRFAATRKVGELKALYNMPVLDQARENAILENISNEVVRRNLPDELIHLFSVIMTAVREEHQQIRDTMQEQFKDQQ